MPDRVGRLFWMLERILAFLMAFLAIAAMPKAFSAEPIRAAVFEFEWIDTSLEGDLRGSRPDEQQRLHQMAERLRHELAKSGHYRIIDIAPKAGEASGSNLQACGGCDADLAKALGAQLAVTGTVQKVSNLILNVNIYGRDADTGRLIVAGSADMRGNTDESWFRALDWIVKNRLLVDRARP
jgi:hypothetical protein